jgi:Raf kinase inhibitor-like YbhB/YbcL family protein
MRITSSAFADGEEIPRKYTQEGSDLSPPLAWSGVPATTRSLALIVDDPDAPDPAAPKRTWVHWVVSDLAPDSPGLPEGVHELPVGHIGLNDYKRPRWMGPKPPIGRHRYFFKLYALDRVLERPLLTKAELEKAMEGHVVAEAQLIGTYQSGSAAA